MIFNRWIPTPYGAGVLGLPARIAVAAIAATIAAMLVALAPPPRVDRNQSVIVRATTGSSEAARSAVEGVGGQVGRALGIIDGFVARVPTSRLSDLWNVDAIESVTRDGQLSLQSIDVGDSGDDTGSKAPAHLIDAPYLWEQGYTGNGVGIALIDSGIVPVEGLRDGVVHGPDLSFEAIDEELRYLDTYGHGTHLAGIAAGRDTDWSLIDTDGDGKGDAGDQDHFAGVAPDATLISIKVAVANGFTDVSQVIAAIDWVVQHRDDHNIRVLNLAFGTDGVQDYRLDPLTHAVEVAWREGIVVVAAAGNEGYGEGRMNDPAYDPFVIAVGATDPGYAKPVHDDVIPAWSSRGDGHRNPDVVAPGTSVVSLRDPGSYIDRRNPDARVGSRFLRGSGTSQAGAVVAGAAALLLDQRPELSPDQVKDLLRTTADPVPSAESQAQGAGVINVRRAAQQEMRQVGQDWQPAAGLGLIDAARGSAALDSVLGEIDVSGAVWDAHEWSVAASEGLSWSGGGWNGRHWSGGQWNSESWSGNSWSGNSWSDGHWSGVWTGNSWSGDGWSGNSWSGNSWSTAVWR